MHWYASTVNISQSHIAYTELATKEMSLPVRAVTRLGKIRDVQI